MHCSTENCAFARPPSDLIPYHPTRQGQGVGAASAGLARGLPADCPPPTAQLPSTDKGKAMALLPLDPSLARGLLAAKDLKCLEQVGWMGGWGHGWRAGAQGTVQGSAVWRAAPPLLGVARWQ